MLCTTVVWITYFLPLVGYLVIIADSVGPTIAAVMPAASGSFARPCILTVFIVVIAPLCFLTQKQLAFFSCLGTFSNCFILAVVLWNFWSQEIPPPPAPGVAAVFSPSDLIISPLQNPISSIAKTPSSTDAGGADHAFCLLSRFDTRGNIAYVSSILMAIVIQPCIPPMYEEMRDRSPARFAKSMLVAWSVLFILFSGFAVAGYLSFGAGTDSNVLNNYVVRMSMLTTPAWE